MSLSLKYKGKDITDSVSIDDYIYDSYSEFHADTLEIKFGDGEELWDKWKPQAGDKVQLKHDTADTGTMFVKELIPMPGYFLLKASSAPVGVDNNRSDAWEGITLFQLGKDIAARYKLKFKTYNAKDTKFAYIEQKQKPDMKFYAGICALSGHAFLIYNETLVLYGMKARQSSAATADLIISGENEFKLITKAEITGCKVSNGENEYEYKKSTQNIKNVVLDIAMNSRAEAMNYAENLCNWFNRDYKSGYFYSKPIAADFSAGSVVNIDTDIAPSFKGKAFITHIRHHYSEGKSKIWFREVR